MHHQVLDALYRLASFYERRGDCEQARRYAAWQLELDPWREEAHQQMMRALALSGQRSAALAQFETCRRVLKKELNAEPMHESITLIERIKLGDLASVHREHNLPAALTPLIGRQRELTEVAQLLENPACRLLSLTGPGGIGKTRLALQAAADQVGLFADGVWFVELAALSEPALVPQTVAAALDLREQAARPLRDLLSDYLRSREVLLVLDNCEHLVEACAQFVEFLLRACPGLCVLVTTRELLDIDGEQVLSLQPLATPNPSHLPSLAVLSQYEAVRLFIDRTMRARPQFALTGDNAFAIAKICHRLDGIPLAIELAARVKDMPEEQIAEQLDRRLQLLTSGSRTAWPQHKTLRATMDWSYSLLSERERRLFQRLSVFAGGWTLEAAEAVCVDELILVEEVPVLLTQLVNKSLVAANASGRYWLLETIREYASEKLSDAQEIETVRSRHTRFFSELAKAGQSTLRGPEQIVWSKRFVTELDNLRTAFHSAQERGDVEIYASLAVSLTWFWEWCGYLHEGRQWLEIALNATVTRPISSELLAGVLFGLGALALRQADFTLAAQFLEQSLVLQRTMDAQSSIAEIVLYLGNIGLTTGDFEQASACYKESATLFRRLGNPWGAALSIGNLGFVALFQRELAQAQVLFDEAMALLHAVGDWFFSGSILLGKGYVHLLQGEQERAEAITRDGLRMINEAGDRLFLNYGLVLMASIAAARQRPIRAARLLGISATFSEMFGVPLPPIVQAMVEQIVGVTQPQLDEASFGSALAEGRAMTLEQAIAYALADDVDQKSEFVQRDER
jgi:predicted ATPase